MRQINPLRYIVLTLVMAALLAGNAGRAAEIAGIQVDDRIKSGSTEMQLNGAGLRTRLIFNIYVAALYLPQKSSDPGTIIQSRAPRRMALRMLRDLDGSTLLNALKDGLRDNHSEAELAALQADISQLEKVFTTVGSTKSGDLIVLDLNNEGLVVTVNGNPRGSVASEALGRALLKIWLGEKPVEASLKKALLGN
ncbi:chalcone isomerase family protein [Uliginosibacterium sp. 31-16]|uniref:chalcone isomerase family protein n=1 Tax=Uliginosibacterium sp. 31-16 TaxID=3068315 RepID=UPI00273F12B5|nr:chalcone isomerase family protein [Uliginosibacterium sp. 31-16]MDP5238505.1 chalcone isomerase family protein [Uliginosibacterium sp. 31-16]